MGRLYSDTLSILKISVVPLLFLSAARFIDNDSRLIDLATHFSLQYLILATISLILFFRSRNRIFGGISLVAVVFNFLAIMPYFPAGKIPETNPDSLKVLLGNVLTSNEQYDSFLSLVNSEQPDLIVTLEINSRWKEKLVSLSDSYPYSLVVSREDNFGIALFGRLPLSNLRSINLGSFQPPTIIAEAKLGERPFLVVATHPLPPALPRGFELRNAQLKDLTSLVRESELPVMVIGDLNTAMWSAAFRNFLKEAGLKDRRRGVGILPTWPVQMPFLYVPIDHILSSESIKVQNLRTVRIEGSDHLGLIADVSNR